MSDLSGGNELIETERIVEDVAAHTDGESAVCSENTDPTDFVTLLHASIDKAYSERDSTLKPVDEVTLTPSKVIATSPWRIQPVIDLTHINALPPASRARELKKAADSFASTGRNLFVHYVTPILKRRREELLTPSLTSKKYFKSAAQLFTVIDNDQNAFWNGAAKRIRDRVKQGALSHEGCLLDAGLLIQRDTYIHHSEQAVAAYLQIPVEESCASMVRNDENHSTSAPENKIDQYLQVCANDFAAINLLDEEDVQHKPNPHVHTPDITMLPTDEIDYSSVLLDTLHEPFTYEKNMLYSHFARYDCKAIHRAEGKHQVAMLRQIADLFDKTGKVLFYYYAVPHLCKRSNPPTAGETVTGQAADIWCSLPGPEKDNWWKASARLKKLLGDGEMVGLVTLKLESLDADVLRLHSLAAAGIQAYETKQKK